jgi:hypothetical protein
MLLRKVCNEQVSRVWRLHLTGKRPNASIIVGGLCLFMNRKATRNRYREQHIATFKICHVL